ncbi:MAG: amino acid permease [Candidatus Aenigmarchaeota archaeon]|nr:amino acid permease [Candidatus Aenigmarchaeota archaeon]
MAKLRRVLGLFELTIVGVGIILGAGIYALVGKAAGLAGNAVWMSFIIAAVISGITGLSYAELSSMFPKAAAEYVYTRQGLGKTVAWFTGWLLILAGATAASTVSLGFAGYLNAMTPVPMTTAAIVLIVVMSIINFMGVKQSISLAVIFSIIEALGLFLIIFVALPHIGSINYFEVKSVTGIFSAAALIFFAFIGFEELVRLAEETKGARKIVPRALILAIIITTIMYILVSLSAVSVLGWERLSASDSPLADVASKTLGRNTSIIMSAIALVATFDTALLVLLAASRIAYGMSGEGSLPKILSYVNPKTGSPSVAIATVGLLAVLFVFMGNIEKVGYLADSLIFISFIVVNLCVIQLRYKQPKSRRGFKVPFNIGKFPVLPLVGIVTTFFLLMNVSYDILSYSVALLMIGFVVYRFFKDNKKELDKANFRRLS